MRPTRSHRPMFHSLYTTRFRPLAPLSSGSRPHTSFGFALLYPSFCGFTCPRSFCFVLRCLRARPPFLLSVLDNDMAQARACNAFCGVSAHRNTPPEQVRTRSCALTRAHTRRRTAARTTHTERAPNESLYKKPVYVARWLHKVGPRGTSRQNRPCSAPLRTEKPPA